MVPGPDEFENIAMFELSTDNARLTDDQVDVVRRDDPALRDAMAYHGLHWFDGSTA